MKANGAILINEVEIEYYGKELSHKFLRKIVPVCAVLYVGIKMLRKLPSKSIKKIVGFFVFRSCE
jgi:hypothetical protein